METKKQDNYKLVCEALANICAIDDVNTIDEQMDACIILGKLRTKLKSK